MAEGESGSRTPPWFWDKRKLEPLEGGQIVAEKFVIERFIGQGGFGQVYEAKELALGRVVALKRLVLIDDLAEEFWKKSIRGLVELGRHPRILEFYSYDRELKRDDDGTPYYEYYLAMEYAPSGSLAQELGAGYGSPRAAVERFLEVLEAVEFLHSKRVVHRDIKSSNVLVASDGSLKLGDFDTLRVLDEVSRLSSFVGTLRYMAPEVAAGRRYDHRADIYSLGLLLTEMLLAEQIGEGVPDEQFERLDEPYRSIVQKAAAVSVEQRYSSCAELRAALEDAIGIARVAAADRTLMSRDIEAEAVEVKEKPLRGEGTIVPQREMEVVEVKEKIGIELEKPEEKIEKPKGDARLKRKRLVLKNSLFLLVITVTAIIVYFQIKLGKWQNQAMTFEELGNKWNDIEALGEADPTQLTKLFSAMDSSNPLIAGAAIDMLWIHEKNVKAALPKLRVIAENGTGYAKEAALWMKTYMEKPTEDESIMWKYWKTFLVKEKCFVSIKPLSDLQKKAVAKELGFKFKTSTECFPLVGVIGECEFLLSCGEDLEIWPFPITNGEAYVVTAHLKAVPHVAGYSRSALFQKLLSGSWACEILGAYDEAEVVGVLDVDGDRKFETLLRYEGHHQGVFIHYRLYSFHRIGTSPVLSVDYVGGGGPQNYTAFGRISFHDVNNDGVQEVILTLFESENKRKRVFHTLYYFDQKNKKYIPIIKPSVEK